MVFTSTTNVLRTQWCLQVLRMSNASYTSTGLTIGSVVTYACDPGYQYEAGFLTRTCLADGTWDGVPPVCSGMLLIHLEGNNIQNNNDMEES
jgi:hypothetical protein